jgi:hypothetical protein|tara:strand:+ start:997 stop:1191 length:195 start_codon:yes stop_codon:yes gene_type:complete
MGVRLVRFHPTLCLAAMDRPQAGRQRRYAGLCLSASGFEVVKWLRPGSNPGAKYSFAKAAGSKA